MSDPQNIISIGRTRIRSNLRKTRERERRLYQGGVLEECTQGGGNHVSLSRSPNVPFPLKSEIPWGSWPLERRQGCSAE